MDTGIILSRAQMARSKSVPNPIDVTVKSSVGVFKHLAPTWSMVMRHKAGTLTDALYTEMYRDILDQANWNIIIHELRYHEHITFMCYCPEGVFCHTHVLINYMLENWPELFIDGRI